MKEKYIAMSGDKKICEGLDLDKVVKKAEQKKSDGDIVVWKNNYIVAQIADYGQTQYTTYY